jgi:glycine/D-amino acid oxidase-like deaminating enzyme
MRSHRVAIQEAINQIAIYPPVPWWQSVDQGTLAQLKLGTLTELRNDQFDVAVIGGGIAGLSAARAAAELGASVIVLEKAPLLGLGASGQNAGIVCVGANLPLVQVKPGSPAFALWHQTAELAQELFERAKANDSLLRARKTGSLFLAKSATARHRLEKEVKLRQGAGLRAELISPDEAKLLCHNCLSTNGVHAAQYLPDEGRVQPLTLLATLAQDARACGATLCGMAEVCRREELAATKARSAWRITTKSGKILRARSVIVCTGPTVKPNARIFALAIKAQLPDDLPIFQDAAPFTYYDYRFGDGFLCVSGGRYGKPGPGPGDEQYWRKMAAAAGQWLPGLASRAPDYRWAVNLNVTPDMIPELKRSNSTAPAISVAGLGALGVLPGVALGRRAALKVVADLKG